MKQHFCPAEQSMIAFENECNWCGEKEVLAQPEEHNFCPRCGKRTKDLTTIHTCTPPQD
jgi:rRNA maturation protein Nop10